VVQVHVTGIVVQVVRPTKYEGPVAAIRMFGSADTYIENNPSTSDPPILSVLILVAPCKKHVASEAPFHSQTKRFGWSLQLR
jgi:hypothetical protein